MNERMLKLALQAGLKKDHASDREYIGDFDWRLFSDLIVRECISTVESVPPGYRDYRDQIEVGMRDYCVEVLKNHFGVKQ